MRVIWVTAVLTGMLCAAAPPTFCQDVPPVSKRNYQSHRDGKAVPMGLVAYRDVNRYACLLRCQDEAKRTVFTPFLNIGKRSE